MSLTPKQERFVAEYLLDLNATQAAIRAGYSEKTANEQAARLLANVSIASEISARQAKLADKFEVTQERIVRELAKIGFSDIRRMFEDDGRLKHVTTLDDDCAAALSSIKVNAVKRASGDDNRHEIENTIEFKLWDKQTALLNLGKHLGMFKDTVKVEVVSIAAEIEAARRRVAGGEPA